MIDGLPNILRYGAPLGCPRSGLRCAGALLLKMTKAQDSLRSKCFRGAKSEEEKGLSAFCPREKWGESLLLIFALAPFSARAKRRKPRFFFALCSTETLATQAKHKMVDVQNKNCHFMEDVQQQSSVHT